MGVIYKAWFRVDFFLMFHVDEIWGEVEGLAKGNCLSFGGKIHSWKYRISCLLGNPTVCLLEGKPLSSRLRYPISRSSLLGAWLQIPRESSGSNGTFWQGTEEKRKYHLVECHFPFKISGCLGSASAEISQQSPSWQIAIEMWDSYKGLWWQILFSK